MAESPSTTECQPLRGALVDVRLRQSWTSWRAVLAWLILAGSVIVSCIVTMWLLPLESGALKPLQAVPAVLLPLVVSVAVAYRVDHWHWRQLAAWPPLRDPLAVREAVLDVYTPLEPWANAQAVNLIDPTLVVAQRLATLAEAAFLIRAWRSPQPPPTLRQLQAWLGTEPVE